MKIKFLGTGSPEGMPILSCNCPWCLKSLKSKQRLRPCILIQSSNTNILLDIGPDIRMQLLQFQKNNKIDAAFITHPHFDHIWGIGDIDQVHWINKETIPIYSNKSTAEYISKYFPWISSEIKAIDEFKEKEIGSISVTAIPIIHSSRKELAMSGFIVSCEGKKVVYIPDIKEIPENSLSAIKGADVLITDGQYILGKYIEDDDHEGGESLQKLILKANAKKTFLIAFSEHWYKMSSENAMLKLKNRFVIPNDNDEIII